MATQTLAAADAVLKDLYPSAIVEQLNQKTFILDQVERDSDHVDFTGRRAVVPVHKSRNRGRASIADGGALPKAGTQGFLDAVVLLRYHTLGIELTDQVIEASKSNEGAFASLLTVETKGAATDMRKDINRQVFGDGSGSLTVEELADSAESFSAGIWKTKTKADLQYIQVGDIIDILVATSGASTNGIEGAEVIERSIANSTFTTATIGKTEAAKESNKLKVYIHGNRSNEMDGLRNITDNERTLHSINSAAAGNTFWKGNVLEAGTSKAVPGIAGESLFEQLADNVGAQGNGDVELFLTSRGIKRRLADSYQSQKRFTDAAAVTVHGGYSAIMVNEIPVISDDDAVKGFAFALNKSALKWFQQNEPGWLERDNGGIFNLKVQAAGEYAAAWQAWFRWYAALGSSAPNRTGQIKFCTDDTPF